MGSMHRCEGPSCTLVLQHFSIIKKYLNRSNLSRRLKWHTAAALRSLYFLEVSASFPKIPGHWPAGWHAVDRLPVSTVTLCGRTSENNKDPGHRGFPVFLAEDDPTQESHHISKEMRREAGSKRKKIRFHWRLMDDDPS